MTNTHNAYFYRNEFFTEMRHLPFEIKFPLGFLQQNAWFQIKRWTRQSFDACIIDNIRRVAATTEKPVSLSSRKTQNSRRSNN